MTGHLTARSVRTESDEKRGEEVVDKKLRVEVFVLPKKGQAFLKRANLSMDCGGASVKQLCVLFKPF